MKHALFNTTKCETSPDATAGLSVRNATPIPYYSRKYSHGLAYMHATTRRRSSLELNSYHIMQYMSRLCDWDRECSVAPRCKIQNHVILDHLRYTKWLRSRYWQYGPTENLNRIKYRFPDTQACLNQDNAPNHSLCEFCLISKSNPIRRCLTIGLGLRNFRTCGRDSSSPRRA